MDWKEIYELPLNDEYTDGSFMSGRIEDKKGNFVFQFLSVDNNVQKKVLDVINGNYQLETTKTFSHEEGYIIINETASKIILIRGWGNLTGSGGHMLNNNDACEVQDTFAEFIVERLNERK